MSAHARHVILRLGSVLAALVLLLILSVVFHP